MNRLAIILVCLKILALIVQVSANSVYVYLPQNLCSNQCAICNLYTNTCSKCAAQFYMHPYYKFCMKSNDSKCETFLTKGICETCIDGYHNDMGDCSTACTLPNCKTCDNYPNVCTTCIDGKYDTPVYSVINNFLLF